MCGINWLRCVRIFAYLAPIILWPVTASAESADEYAAKAAFIYNIALFSTFPDQSQDTLHLCVLGRDPFGSTLKAMEGKLVGAKKLAVHYPKSSTEAAKRCRIVFISSSEVDNLQAIVDSAQEAGTLTVADTRGAAQKGVMVELAVEDKRIAFEINNERARAANITISSKVLRLARVVY